MKANNYISHKEHKLLLIFAFTSFAFVLSIITWQSVKDYNYSVSKYQQKLKTKANDEIGTGIAVDGIETRLPLIHLLTALIFIALLKTKRFLLPLLLTVFYGLIFIYGLSLGYEDSILASPNINISSVEKIYLIADFFDYLAFFFVSILLFWQISILLRMLIKTLQRKTELP